MPARESEGFRVVFSGRAKDGCDPGEVQKKLAATFKMDPARVAALFTGRPTVIKKQVDRATAEKYRSAFDRAGAVCRMEPASKAPREVADSPQSAATPTPAAPTEPSSPPPLHPAVSNEASPTSNGLAPIAGFWRRTFGFAIDVLLLGALGHGLAFFLFDRFAEIGSAGRLIGFAVSLIYFGLLDSRINAGQTLGKMALGIRVVDGRGGALPLPRAIVRFAILGVPFYLNGLMLPFDSRVLPGLLGFLIFGVGGTLLYLYIFNRRTRQSLHDLAVGSYVVMARPGGAPARSTVWRGHLALAGLWCLAVLAGVFMLPETFLDRPLFVALNETRSAILELDGVGQVAVVDGKRLVNGNSTTYLQANVQVDAASVLGDDIADDVARIVLTKYPGAMKKDRLHITLTYGFDIGIASSWRNNTYSYPPEEWMERLGRDSL